MEERLQKILARAGYGSRRANEELIMAGRVRVNNQIANLGMKADPQKDTIYVDGTAIGKSMPQFIYVAVHKPRNVLSDEDPQDPRPTVRGLVEVPGHLFPVGRLDFDSEGLILLTNDGELANRLTHPRYEHEKEYRVLVAARPDEKQLMTWRRGVVLEDGTRTRPATVVFEGPSGKGAWIRVILKEGKKRQIREVGKTIGLPVVRILRIRIGTLLLGNLKPREWRYLTPKEVADLKQLQQRDKPVTRPNLSRQREAVESKFARAIADPKGAARPSSRSGSGRPARRPGDKPVSSAEQRPRSERPARTGQPKPAARPGSASRPAQRRRTPPRR